MSYRLTPDSHVIGYWGFDETLETDNAVDESSYADASLTVSGSPSVQLGRIGNARTLSGGAFGSVTIPRLRVTGDLHLLIWFRMVTVSNSGTLLRCLMSCGTGTGQNYAIYVDNAGRVVYKHTSASGEVIVRTATNVIKVGQFYHLSVSRASNVISFVVDNFQIPVADVTVNAVSSTQPVPAPSANAGAVFYVGKSALESDSAFWDGLVDEASVHDIARAYQPYVRGVYFMVALRSTTMRTTSTSTVLSVSSSDMGSGVRWWCFERDKELYVVKESPFGKFGSETRLTTPSTALFTASTSPELIYDKTTDTLLVLFVTGNRIFKLTANSTDDPATINMPFTSDVGSIIKMVDNVDGGRLGTGGGQREVVPFEYTQNTALPIKTQFIDSGALGMGGGQEQVTVFGTPNTPNVAFTTHPTLGFGVVVGPVDSELGLSGVGPFSPVPYAAYAVNGGAPLQLASPTLIGTSFEDYKYFIPIATRVYGQGYFVQALRNGQPTGIFSPTIIDRFNELLTGPIGNLYLGRDGDCSDGGALGMGGGAREVWIAEYTYVDRQPVKYSGQDPDTNLLGASGGGQSGSVTQSTTTVIL